jgi:hypothetical protein
LVRSGLSAITAVFGRSLLSGAAALLFWAYNPDPGMLQMARMKILFIINRVYE